MAGKRYDQFSSGTYDKTKIFLQGDPTTGALEKVNLPTPGDAPLDLVIDAIGSTPTDALTVENTTAATSGNTEFSPAIIFKGHAWDGSTSALIEIRCYINTLSGGAKGYLIFEYRVNSGTWTTLMTLGQSAGGVNTGVGFGGALPGNTASATLSTIGSITNNLGLNVAGGTLVQSFGATLLSASGANPTAILKLADSTAYKSVVTRAALVAGQASNGDDSAILEAVSKTKGLLPPRMTSAQKNAISSPGPGLMVYDETLAKLCLFTGSAWETITSV